jgi:hypothetical protein
MARGPNSTSGGTSQRPKALVTILLAIAAVCVSGCTNGRVSEQDDINGTVRTFLDQCAEQDVLRVLPALVPSAQKVVVEAGSATRGCARVLGSTPLPAAAFANAREQITAFDGGRARVAIDIAGHRRLLELSRGEPLWRIEGP